MVLAKHFLVLLDITFSKLLWFQTSRARWRDRNSGSRYNEDLARNDRSSRHKKDRHEISGCWFTQLCYKWSCEFPGLRKCIDYNGLPIGTNNCSVGTHNSDVLQDVRTVWDYRYILCKNRLQYWVSLYIMPWIKCMSLGINRWRSKTWRSRMEG